MTNEHHEKKIIRPTIEPSALRSLSHRLWIEYILVWALPVVSLILHGVGLLEEGALAHDGRLCYILQTCTVLLTLCLVPASLKWFAPDMSAGLTSYRRRSETRLALLAIVIIVGLSIYHTTLGNMGGLCAAVGLVATLFCVPSPKRDYENLQANS